MKAVMILGIIIGILLCALFYVATRYTGNITSAHSKIIEKNSYETVKAVCHQQIEYLIVNGSGTAITVASDQDGKPLKCNY